MSQAESYAVPDLDPLLRSGWRGLITDLAAVADLVRAAGDPAGAVSIVRAAYAVADMLPAPRQRGEGSPDRRRRARRVTAHAT